MEYTTSITDADLTGILDLQKANLKEFLKPDEINKQGFVTLTHNLAELKKLNNIEKSIIVKERGKIVAYVLAMTKRSRIDLPLLIPMFNLFDEITYNNKCISDYDYMMVGQVCVAKEYRGQNIFDNSYKTYKEYFQNRYDFAITEIASTNLRSLNAHKRIGFKKIHKYTAPDKMEWNIVLWDWKNNNS